MSVFNIVNPLLAQGIQKITPSPDTVVYSHGATTDRKRAVFGTFAEALTEAQLIRSVIGYAFIQLAPPVSGVNTVPTGANDRTRIAIRGGAKIDIFGTDSNLAFEDGAYFTADDHIHAFDGYMKIDNSLNTVSPIDYSAGSPGTVLIITFTNGAFASQSSGQPLMKSNSSVFTVLNLGAGTHGDGTNPSFDTAGTCTLQLREGGVINNNYFSGGGTASVSSDSGTVFNTTQGVTITGAKENNIITGLTIGTALQGALGIVGNLLRIGQDFTTGSSHENPLRVGSTDEPESNLHTDSFGAGYNVITNDTTLDDTHCVVSVDVSGGDVELTLPDAGVSEGRMYICTIESEEGSAECQLKPQAGQTVNGLDPYSFTGIGASVLVVSEGGNSWRVIKLGNIDNIISTSSSNYTVKKHETFIIADTSSNNVTLNLPSTSGMAGNVINIIKSSNDNEVIIDPDSTETINGDATNTIYGLNQVATIICDGSNWFFVNNTEKAGIYHDIVEETATTRTATHTDDLVTMTNATSRTYTLPPLSEANNSADGSGRIVTVRNPTDDVHLLVEPDGSDTIEGDDQYVVFGGGSVSFVAESTEWKVYHESNNHTVYQQMTDKTVANTASQGTLFDVTNAIGNRDVPANTVKVGDTIKLYAFGHLDADSGDDITLTFKIGSASIISETITLNNGVALTDQFWDIHLYGVVRSVGVSGSLVIGGEFHYSNNQVGGIGGFSDASAITLDTTAINSIDLLAQWSDASATNSITLQGMRVEIER